MTQPKPTLYKLEFYVPEQNLESVKQAMFAAGAGRVGNYDCCAWQTRGEGQFRPLTGSTPHLGQQDKLEHTPEYKVEMICEEPHLKAVLAAMKSAHPYDEVAHSVIRLTSVSD
ncbi:MAG: NGG1p interacting factor NIF3 [Pseudohongiellaceae bacterium]